MLVLSGYKTDYVHMIWRRHKFCEIGLVGGLHMNHENDDVDVIRIGAHILYDANA